MKKRERNQRLVLILSVPTIMCLILLATSVVGRFAKIPVDKIPSAAELKQTQATYSAVLDSIPDPARFGLSLIYADVYIRNETRGLDNNLQLKPTHMNVDVEGFYTKDIVSGQVTKVTSGIPLSSLLKDTYTKSFDVDADTVKLTTDSFYQMYLVPQVFSYFVLFVITLVLWFGIVTLFYEIFRFVRDGSRVRNTKD